MVVNDYLTAFAGVGGILLLFLDGLNIQIVEFKTAPKTSVALGLLGMLSPLVLGVAIYNFLEHNLLVAFVVSACLTTSNIKLMQSLTKRGIVSHKKSHMIVNAAAVDNVLGVLILSVAISFLEGGHPSNLSAASALVLRPFVFSMIMLAVTVTLVPRIINRLGLGASISVGSAAL